MMGRWAMKTLLLTWNPEHFPWDGLSEDVEDVWAGAGAKGNWSVGVRRGGVEPGDRFFMLRQGAKPRGIMASGTIESNVQRRPHWDDPTKTANYVDITFDVLVDPDEDPDLMIPMQDLLDRFEGRFYFKRVQSSGQQLPDDVVDELERMWAERHGPIEARISDDEENSEDDELDDAPESDYEPLSGEVDEDEDYGEGAVCSVLVNRYERSAAARRACIQEHGSTCCVCGFDFEEAYGELGAGFIEVHHIVPLAEVGEGYHVDPINDLRPICPNCHAMIHHQDPPVTIEDLRDIVNERQRRA